MSGYDKISRVFELTSKKASYWFRRKEVPKELYEPCECCYE
jgi:hypothetical protein